MKQYKKHSARYFHIKNADTVAVFIHGILGSPSQFEFMEEAARERGFSTVNLLLPGHGASAKDFAKSNPSLWKAHVDEEVSRLSGQYERIFLVGHSMGGLLALNAMRSTRVSGIFSLALPLYARLSLRSIRTSMLTALSLGKNDEYVIAASEARGVGECSLITYITWLPNFIRLLFFAREIRNSLSGADARVCLLFGAKDELVSARSITAARKLPRHSIHVLPCSSHYIYSAGDRETILKHFCEFTCI